MKLVSIERHADNISTEVRRLMDRFIANGFTRQQAFELAKMASEVAALAGIHGAVEGEPDGN